MAYTDIDKPSDYFNTVLYTGNGGTNNITGVGFQPDWVWLKQRNLSNRSHHVYDVVRGVQKFLHVDGTIAEGTQTNAVSSFDSDGFTVGNNINLNGSSDTYVSWNWLADNTSGSSNTDGSITSTVSANTTSGFSIVSYTASASGSNTDTIGHGLSAVPKMIIIKTTSADAWRVYHHVPGVDKHGSLNNTNGFNTNTNIFPTLPTTSVFYPGSDASTNSSSRTYVAYCFAEKKGFSKFGSYTGNGSTDGTFVYTGFKPAWVMIKCTSTTESWDIKDNKRNPYNTCDNGLRANQSSADDINTTYHMIDYLSNGFKLRGANQNLVNGSGQSYIYMCFSENPFVSSLGIPTTAR